MPVKVGEEQYRYLVQGEYVEFTCIKTDSDEHEYQATDVTGIRGGQLMYETHAQMRADRASMREKFLSGEKPEDMDEEEWTLIRKRAQERGGRGRRTRTLVVAAVVVADAVAVEDAVDVAPAKKMPNTK